jgi:hypothetical protein
MSFFARVWTGEYEGHKLQVRQRTGHNYVLLIDNEQTDSYTSPINMGKRVLKGTIKRGEQTFEVDVVCHQGAFTESVTVTVNGQEIEMAKK